MITKKPSESLTILTDLVLPGETNYLDNLFGGELLARMDRACSIAARRHSRRIVVTASVNQVVFSKSVPVGSVVTVEAKVSRAFKSSMEVYVDVWIEDRQSRNIFFKRVYINIIVLKPKFLFNSSRVCSLSFTF